LKVEKVYAIVVIATVHPPKKYNWNSLANKKIRFGKISLVKNVKLKLLLDLHDARPAPTKPGYQPA
jgi:hypothetical protein